MKRRKRFPWWFSYRMAIANWLYEAGMWLYIDEDEASRRGYF